MAKTQTFAQYLINSVLPQGITIDKPVDKKELNNILSDVHNKYPAKYSDTVSALKRLGDDFSTWETLSFGMDELQAPHKAERDRIINRYAKLYEGEKDEDKKAGYLEQVQDEVSKLDLKDAKDDASLMVTSGAMAGKRFQLMKLRSSPVVLKNHKGELVPQIVRKSYAEGMDIDDYWNGAAEARANLVQGQVATSEPGVFNKVTHNLMSDMVVSTQDCGTSHGIMLDINDGNLIDRYLAAATGGYRKGTLISAMVQHALKRAKVKQVLVRSPQTCEAPGNSVCAMCMGKSVGKRKNFEIGENAGAISAGALSEVSQQLVLSAKHSTTMAKHITGLHGMKGLQALTEMPKVYPDKRIQCEMYGVVDRIIPAPQGGKFLQIRETRKVAAKYKQNAISVPNKKGYWQYYVPPQRKIEKGIKIRAEVYPGMVLTDGNVNLKDVARLQSLGAARSEAADNIQKIYKTTGNDLDRRHFEMMSRAMLNYVKLEKVPAGFPFKRGETVQYNKLRGMVDKLNAKPVSIDMALGKTMAEEISGITVGTEVTPAVQSKLKQVGRKSVKITHDLEIEPAVTPITRAQNMNSDQWLSNMNHRYLKDTIKGAATENRSQNIHGYSPIASYAYGTEMRQDEVGRY